MLGLGQLSMRIFFDIVPNVLAFIYFLHRQIRKGLATEKEKQLHVQEVEPPKRISSTSIYAWFCCNAFHTIQAVQI